ncbi:adhesin, partial [Xanthomonas oryzae pv. oryzae]
AAGNSSSLTAATGVGSVALGAGAVTQSNYAIALGYNANVFPNLPGNTDAVAIGHSAGSFAPNTVSLGAYALASNQDGIAVGHNSWALSANSVVLGSGAISSWFNPNSTALGAATRTDGVDATSIGYGAKVGNWVDDAWNRAPVSAVALGAFSHATRSYSVAVGDLASGLTRQITSVAAGTEATDAVNKGQLDALA